MKTSIVLALARRPSDRFDQFVWNHLQALLGQKLQECFDMFFFWKCFNFPTTSATFADCSSLQLMLLTKVCNFSNCIFSMFENEGKVMTLLKNLSEALACLVKSAARTVFLFTGIPLRFSLDPRKLAEHERPCALLTTIQPEKMSSCDPMQSMCVDIDVKPTVKYSDNM